MRPQTRSSTLGALLVVALLVLAAMPAAFVQASPVAQGDYWLSIGTYNSSPSVFEEVHFDSTFYDYSEAGRYISSYSWSFGDGATSEAEPYASHRYSTQGAYLVTLTAILSDGSTATASLTLTVRPIEITIEAQYGDLDVFHDASFNIGFYDWMLQPSCTWNFGDGSTPVTGPCGSGAPSVKHRYEADGSYSVSAAITLYDGAQTTATRDVVVSTHDVAITRVQVPKSARVGQSRDITVSIANWRQDEPQVMVDLYVSNPSYGSSYPYPGDDNGFRLVSSSIHYIRVQPRNRTTDVTLSHVFTPDDATLGKVNFKVRLSIMGPSDAQPANNTYISLPVSVR